MQARLAAAKNPATASDSAGPQPAPIVPQDDGSDPSDDVNSPADVRAPLRAEAKMQPAGDPGHPPQVATANRHSTETPAAVATDAQSDAPKAAAEAMPTPTPATALHDTSAPPVNPAALAPKMAASAAIPLAGVAVEIAGKALAGKNRFEIRLDPPELGRIEVRLDVDRDGHAVTHLMADRSDTLDLLRRDSAGLERALQDAGVKTGDNGLQFSLRDQGMARDQGNSPASGTAQLLVSDDIPAAVDAGPRNYSRGAGLGGGIDIRV